MKYRLKGVVIALFALSSISQAQQLTSPERSTRSVALPEAAGVESTIPAAPAPSTAKAWIVMDYATKQVLAGENIHEHLAPASMTKVMTSYAIAAEIQAGRVKRTDPVLMSENAWRKGGAGTDGSYSGFPVNKTASLDEMEKGMVVQSGNDAAIAIAEHIAGSEDAFAALMNTYAQRLGLHDTHFVDVTGLSVQGHYSSAYDMALLGRALIHDYPSTYAYNKIKELTVNGIKQPNRNLLLWRDPSVDGIKTGHTSEAGYCIMNSAQRGDQRLITVIMGAGSERQRADASMALLTWGFRFFQTYKMYDPSKEVASEKLWKGTVDNVKLTVNSPLLVTIPRGQYSRLQPSMHLPKLLEAPIVKGQKIGTLDVMLDGKQIAQAPLVAMNDVPMSGFFDRLWDSALLWWESK